MFTGLLLRGSATTSEHGEGSSSILNSTRLRVGIVPAGSTDAVALTHHGTDDVTTALLHIVLGHRIAVDVVGVTSVDAATKRHTFEKLSLAMTAYGYFGDLMKKSEKLRLALRTFPVDTKDTNFP